MRAVRTLTSLPLLAITAAASGGDDGTGDGPRTELLIGANRLASGPHVRRVQSEAGAPTAEDARAQPAALLRTPGGRILELRVVPESVDSCLAAR